MGIPQVELQYLVRRYTCSDMLLTYASAQSINGITLKTPLEKIKLGNLDEKGTFLELEDYVQLTLPKLLVTFASPKLHDLRPPNSSAPESSFCTDRPITHPMG